MATSTRGLKEWIIQRVTALYLAIYMVAAIVIFMVMSPINYVAWQALFSNLWVQIATLLFLISLLWHAWIGIWTVLTDYIKYPALRMTLQVLVMLALLIYFLWGLKILWGI